MPKHFWFLLIAVVFETIGTTSLQASQQFTRLWPSLFVVIGFAGAMYFLTLTLKYMPLGVVKSASRRIGRAQPVQIFSRTKGRCAAGIGHTCKQRPEGPWENMHWPRGVAPLPRASGRLSLARSTRSRGASAHPYSRGREATERVRSGVTRSVLCGRGWGSC